MQKRLFLLTVLFFTVITTFAQSNARVIQLGAGLSYGIPLAPNSSSTPYAGALILRLQSPVNSRLSLIFKTGFSVYAAGDVSLGSYDANTGFGTPATGTIWSFIPVEIGAKFYIVNKLYVEGDAGVSFFVNYHPGGNQLIAPIVSPGFGYDIPLGSSKNSLDLGIDYENRINYSNAISDFSEVAFHAILNFEL